MAHSVFTRSLDSYSNHRKFRPPYEVRTRTRKNEQLGFTSPELNEEVKSYSTTLTSPAAAIEEERRAMETEIAAADFVLNIENDMEVEDFEPYSKETLDRATGFLRRLMLHAHKANVVGMGIPKIGPADHGSIDLFWEKGGRMLLINFPAAEDIANYYGKKAKSEISGRFEPSEAGAELVSWLVNN